MTLRPVAFSGGLIDRADHLRGDAAALERLKDDKARLLRLDGLDPLLAAGGGLSWTGLDAASPGGELIFLGLDEAGNACFAQAPEGPFARAVPKGPGAGPATWEALAVLSRSDLAVYGAARGLIYWHLRHRFCSVCGKPSDLAKGGWQRICTDPTCRAEHFPRVDPATIMLVEHSGRLLLGRQPRFPPRRYSALAGFVEPGETIEEAVAREIHEEAGVRVRSVSYVASQPWPFPSSMMIACHAFASDDRLSIDRTELEDARWFSRDEVAQAMAARDEGRDGAAFSAPAPSAVANVLLNWWLERG